VEKDTRGWLATAYGATRVKRTAAGIKPGQHEKQMQAMLARGKQSGGARPEGRVTKRGPQHRRQRDSRRDGNPTTKRKEHMRWA